MWHEAEAQSGSLAPLITMGRQDMSGTEDQSRHLQSRQWLVRSQDTGIVYGLAALKQLQLACMYESVHVCVHPVPHTAHM